MSGERSTVEAPVDEVVLLEDRAHVYRRLAVDRAAGRHRLRIDAVAPVLADKTLSVAVEEGVGVTVVGASVGRRLITRDPDVDDSAVGKLERELEQLDDRATELAHERSLIEQQARELDRLAALSYRELATDVSWGTAVDDGWSARLERLRADERALREKQSELAFEAVDLDRLRARLRTRIQQAMTPAEAARAWIDLDLELEADGAATIRVDYVVPGACWRPAHRAELIENGDGARVRFSTDACVWQNSGEDWTNARLSFSTERASLGTEPPRLATDLLRWRKKTDAIVVQTREQAIETTGLGLEGAAAPPASELPGIDDGGEAINLRARERADVPSDGRPHKIPIASFEADAALSLVAYPELSPCVFTKVVFTNRGVTPILAGPVELIRSSGPVGRTSVMFVAPDEQLELGWGPEAEVRLKRTSRTRDEKSKMLSSWISRGHEIEIALSNIGDSPRTVELCERVPVSEIDKVKIELEDGAVADADGFVTWKVDLPPMGHDKRELRYLVKKHEDVVGF